LEGLETIIMYLFHTASRPLSRFWWANEKTPRNILRGVLVFAFLLSDI
jgi:hypothetical protein